MPCDMSSVEEMTAAGMLDEEIKQLQVEVTLARAKAERAGLTENKPMIEIVQDMEKAELDCREVAHDRVHRRMADEATTFFDSLKLSLHLARAKEKVAVNNE